VCVAVTSQLEREKHIVIDARMIGDGGIGTYLQNVVPRVARLHPEWRFTVLGDRERLRAAGWTALPNIRVRTSSAPIYSVREQIEMVIRCPADADVYWAPHYNIPVLLSKRLAVTIHDVCHIAVPEPGNGALRRTYAQFMLGSVRRRARVILFDSEFSQSEMRRLVGDPAGAFTVAHLAVDDDWFAARERFPDRPMPEPYLLYVGNIKRHKNVPMLLRAFRDIQDRIPHTLVLIGRSVGLRGDPEVDSAARDSGPRVVFAGELPTEQVQRYVAHADACVTASLYEGFGLPALEAMAAGSPCLVSSAGSLPEICGNAAIYCDPRDRASIAGRMYDIATDASLRQRLVARGRERARQFSWDRCAAATAQLLERAFR
jgi:glycosyltransferase involved in cell wall biosynthesis